MGWRACRGVRLKEGESTSLRVSECVRMLVDGLVGLCGREVES